MVSSVRKMFRTVQSPKVEKRDGRGFLELISRLGLKDKPSRGGGRGHFSGKGSDRSKLGNQTGQAGRAVGRAPVQASVP